MPMKLPQTNGLTLFFNSNFTLNGELSLNYYEPG